jgi:TonB family protein
MRPLKKITGLLGFALALAAPTVGANRTDREIHGLKGPVGSLRVEVANLSTDAGKFVEGKRVRTEKIVYDDKGNVAWQTTYAADLVLSSRFYSNQSDGTQSETAHVRKSASPGGGPPGFSTTRFIWTHKSDSSGNRIESTARNNDGAVVRRLEYSYDKSGKLMTVASYGDNATLVEKYSYDSTGEINERADFNDRGSIVEQDSYSYEHDAQKNWVKRITSRKQEGKSIGVEVTYRTIAYYPPIGKFQVAGVFTPGGVPKGATGPYLVLSSQTTKRVEPVYPITARAAHISGDVVVELIVDEEGDVLSARAISGHPLLKEAALNAAWDWKFSPTIYQGRPVKVIGQIEFHFHI